MFDFPSFARTTKKGKSDRRPQTTLTPSSSDSLSLSLAAHDTQTRTHTKGRKQKSHRSNSFTRKTARKRDKTCSRVSSSSSFRDKRRANVLFFFLSGCETTTEETLFRPSLFCAMMAFAASFALLCHDARARERESDRQTERKTRVFILPR